MWPKSYNTLRGATVRSSYPQMPSAFQACPSFSNMESEESKMSEIWRDIPGYDDMYMVSNLGNVRSKDRFDSWGRLRKGRVLKFNNLHLGYKNVTLCGSFGRKGMLVHRLVCLAFLGPANGRVVDHLDENPSNNKLENLEYVTQMENVRRYHGKRKYLYISYRPNRHPKRPYILT